MTAEVKIISSAVGVFLAIFLGGLVAILMSKFRIYRLERAEYKKFKNEQKMLSGMNPLYKSPTTEYRNPLHKAD